MPPTPTLTRFHKLIDDISRLYIKARNAQVEFALEVGRRLVEEEQHGAVRATRGAGLIHRVSEVMTQKYGAGFSESNLLKMRRFYLLNPKQSISTDMDWSDYDEILFNHRSSSLYREQFWPNAASERSEHENFQPSLSTQSKDSLKIHMRRGRH